MKRRNWCHLLSFHVAYNDSTTHFFMAPLLKWSTKEPCRKSDYEGERVKWTFSSTHQNVLPHHNSLEIYISSYRVSPVGEKWNINTISLHCLEGGSVVTTNFSYQNVSCSPSYHFFLRVTVTDGWKTIRDCLSSSFPHFPPWKGRHDDGRHRTTKPESKWRKSVLWRRKKGERQGRQGKQEQQGDDFEEHHWSLGGTSSASFVFTPG